MGVVCILLDCLKMDLWTFVTTNVSMNGLHPFMICLVNVFCNHKSLPLQAIKVNISQHFHLGPTSVFYSLRYYCYNSTITKAPVSESHLYLSMKTNLRSFRSLRTTPWLWQCMTAFSIWANKSPASSSLRRFLLRTYACMSPWWPGRKTYTLCWPITTSCRAQMFSCLPIRS